MIYIYAADIRHLKDPKKYPESLHSLDDETQKEILEHNTLNSRIVSLGTALLLEKSLLRYNMDNHSNNTQILESPHFSFSHSKNIIICALSENAVGCDIKKIENVPKKLPLHIFSLNERKYLNSFSGEKFNHEFYRLWSIKESYIKMTGEIFSSPAQDIEISIDEEIELFRNGKVEDCLIEEYFIPGYKTSVCAKEDDFATDIKFIAII